MIIFGVIGVIVGLTMGVTGAGGAIISIPLFQLLAGSSLKEATVLSLLAVIFGTSSNLLPQLKEVKWKLVIGLSVFGILSNYLTFGIKQKIPDLIIVAMLIVIGLYSIIAVWQKETRLKESQGKMSASMIIITGLTLGIITTITGLGGGALLIPAFLRIFHLHYEEALPSSLATIFIVSLSSLLFQGDKALSVIGLDEIAAIGIGALFSFLLLRQLIQRLEESSRLHLRRIIFSLVTAASLIMVIYKSMH